MRYLKMYKMASEEEDEDLEALKLAALASMKRKQQVKPVSTDDLEDPELVALREAALLTKKNIASENNSVENNALKNAAPFPHSLLDVGPQFGFPYNYPPPQSNYSTPVSYSVPPLQTITLPATTTAFSTVVSQSASSALPLSNPVPQNQTVADRGVSPFTKSLERKNGSNLIVITQAGGVMENPDSTQSETDTKPQLLRPQEKWLGTSDGNSSTASPARRPKTSDKFSRFDSSDNSDESESDSDDELLFKKKDNSISSDDENDSNKENSENTSSSPSSLSNCENDENKTTSNNIAEHNQERTAKPHSKENVNVTSGEMKQKTESESICDKSELKNSISKASTTVLNNNRKRDSGERKDRHSNSPSSDRVSDLSEKLRNRKAKMKKDLSEKLLNRKKDNDESDKSLNRSGKKENDLSEKLLNRKFRVEGDLSEKLSSRKEASRKNVQDLSQKLTSRKNKQPVEENKLSSEEKLPAKHADTDIKSTAAVSQDSKVSSNECVTSGMTEEEAKKLEARKLKFETQKSLDLMQVPQTISLKSIKKRKKKKVKASRSRSRSLPRQYRHPPRSPSLPRQYREDNVRKSRSPHHVTRDRSPSLPRQYRSELRDQHKQRDRKGNKIETFHSSHNNSDKHRRGSRLRLSDRLGSRRHSSGDKNRSDKKQNPADSGDSDKESDSCSLMSDVESDDSEGRSWRNEANKNRVRRRSVRNVNQIPNSLTVSRPFGDRQHSNRNISPPDRFRDRRKRHDHFDRNRFQPKRHRYDNFTVKRTKRFQSDESDNDDDAENGDKKISSSVVLPKKNIASEPPQADETNTDSDSVKRSQSTKRNLLPDKSVELSEKRRVVNSDNRTKTRRVTADYGSGFDARDYLKSRTKMVDENTDDKLISTDSGDSRNSKGGLLVTSPDEDKDEHARTSVHNRLGSVLGKSKEKSRSLLTPVLKNTEERTVKRVKSKTREDGLYEDDLEIRIKQIKEKNAAILRRQEEIKRDKERFGYK